MKNRDQVAAYYECRQMLEEAKNMTVLTKVANRIMDIAREHKFDDVHMDKLEQVGMRRYEQLTREMAGLMRNKKIGS